MEFKELTETDKTLFADAMLKMLYYIDAEFVPPLSKRRSTTQNNLTGEGAENGIEAYFSEMIKQDITGVFENNELIGFVSYRKNYTSEIIFSSELPNIYISTLVLSRQSRGRGITKELYSYLFNTLFPESSIFTRTWSTNIAHTRILSYFGFSELLRIENDRGDGIDTVYYKREKTKA